MAYSCYSPPPQNKKSHSTNLFLGTTSVRGPCLPGHLRGAVKRVIPFLDTLCEPKAQTFPPGESEVGVWMLHPHNKGNPTPPPPASYEEHTLIVVPAGGECGCVNQTVPVQFFIATLASRHTEDHQTLINPRHQCCRILFRCCWISTRDGRAA